MNNLIETPSGKRREPDTNILAYLLRNYLKGMWMMKECEMKKIYIM